MILPQVLCKWEEGSWQANRLDVICVNSSEHILLDLVCAGLSDFDYRCFSEELVQGVSFLAVSVQTYSTA